MERNGFFGQPKVHEAYSILNFWFLMENSILKISGSKDVKLTLTSVLKHFRFLKNDSPGMVQLEVNSSSLLSTLRPRSLAIVLRRKTQASSMTAVTVAETRLRLLRGNHPGLLCKPLFPPSWPPWPPWPLRSEGMPPEMKTFIEKKKQLFLHQKLF
jgi:hypothetical protein